MRIAGGELRNRTLKVPKTGVRPTSDKVRQAVFNMLEARGAVEDAYVLDAFCGSGALGLEALSRGAAFCTFWDKSPESMRFTKDNIGDLGLEEKSLCVLQSIMKIGACDADQEKFSLVFLDPPYDAGLMGVGLEGLQTGGWLADDAMIVMEMRDSDHPPASGIDIFQEKIYGDTKVLLAYNTPV